MDIYSYKHGSEPTKPRRGELTKAALSPREELFPRENANQHLTPDQDAESYTHGPLLEAQKLRDQHIRDVEDTFWAYVVFYLLLTLVLFFGISAHQQSAVDSKGAAGISAS